MEWLITLERQHRRWAVICRFIDVFTATEWGRFLGHYERSLMYEGGSYSDKPDDSGVGNQDRPTGVRVAEAVEKARTALFLDENIRGGLPTEAEMLACLKRALRHAGREDLINRVRVLG